MSVSRLLKAIESKKRGTSYEDSFLDAYNESVLSMQEDRPIPTDRFRPSSLADGCERMLWYQRKGIGAVGEKKDVALAEICDNGTDRHERIQNTIKNIPGLEWLDVEEVVKEANSRGINTRFLSWDDKHTEAKCYSEDYNFNFLCDGIFRYKGKDIILEIKTIHQIGHNRLVEPMEKHIRQATCYAMAMGIDEILFFYEDRNFMKKKAYLYKVTDEDKDYIRSKISRILNYLEENRIPPKEPDKCLYCDRKTQCKKDGDKEFYDGEE